MSSIQTIDTIEQLLNQYEDVIKKCIATNTNRNELDEYEMRLNHNINKLEYSVDSQKEFFYYKHKFLKIKYSFLKTLGYEDESKRIETLLLEYEPITFETYLNTNDDSNSSDIGSMSNINPFMKCVGYLIENNAINNKTAKKLNQFYCYKEMVIHRLDEFNLMSNIYNDLNIEIYNRISSFESDKDDLTKEILFNLFQIEEFLNNLRIEFTTGFMVHTLSVNKPESILFANIDQTPESIKKHYFKLLLKFHMDKLQNWFPSNKKELMESFYRLIEQCKKTMLSRLNLHEETNELEGE